MRKHRGQYHRLIDKVKRYTKYQEDFAIGLDGNQAIYNGTRTFAQQITIVTQDAFFQAYIVTRNARPDGGGWGSRIEWSKKDPIADWTPDLLEEVVATSVNRSGPNL